MKSLHLAASIIASITAATALAQGGPVEPCTSTATPCFPAPTGNGIATITEYATPFTTTVFQSFDCHGCGHVTVIPKECYGPGPVDTSTITVVRAEKTVTTDVCSPSLK